MYRCREKASQDESNRLFYKRQKPVILVPCKEITAEALSILHDIPFQVDFMSAGRYCNIVDFVSSNPFEERLNKKQPMVKWCMMSLSIVKQIRKSLIYSDLMGRNVYRLLSTAMVLCSCHLRHLEAGE
jgi:hypothetical protein